MMICAADFEELFPDLFAPEPAFVVRPAANAPSAECIARWEDDGGSHAEIAPSRRNAPARSPASKYDIERMATAGAIAATAPAVATYAAASALFSAYDHMTARREVIV
ncbi:hypothetical protein I5535_14065 [Rhodobacteraceae bacterium F11138]|nr:hypothetical protein [Rhodobacteraceae bacterium F11138]